MKELSLHILDLAENSAAADAKKITISVDENTAENSIEIKIKDDGKGVSAEMLNKMIDPFVTTRTTRRVGMGLSLFKAAAERCEGAFFVSSELGKGTVVTASFQLNHIDRAPVGDMASTIISLIAGYPEIDIVYTHMYDGNEFVFDTCEIRVELEEIPLNEPTVLQHLKHAINNELNNLKC